MKVWQVHYYDFTLFLDFRHIRQSGKPAHVMSPLVQSMLDGQTQTGQSNLLTVQLVASQPRLHLRQLGNWYWHHFANGNPKRPSTELFGYLQ